MCVCLANRFVASHHLETKHNQVIFLTLTGIVDHRFTIKSYGRFICSEQIYLYNYYIQIENIASSVNLAAHQNNKK